MIQLTSLALLCLTLSGPLLPGPSGERVAEDEPRPASEAWSRFRGPNGSGIADAGPLPVRFGKEENLVWRTELPRGRSSPVLDRERVYLTAFEGEELRTLALDRADGRVLWSRVAPRDRTTQVDARNDPVSPTPVVAGGRIVVFFPDYGLLAYDVAGEEQWRRPLGPFENLYGMGASPIVVGDRVILACDQNRGSYVAAFDLASGEELWRSERPWAKSGHCTPILWETPEGRTQVLLPGSFYLDAYDPETGERVWWAGGLSFEMKSVPVLHGGLVFTNGYGSPMNDPGNQVEIPDFDENVAARDADEDGLVSEGEMPESRASAWFAFVDLDASGELDRDEWEYLQAALASRNGLLAIRPGGKGERPADALVWSYHRSIPQLPSPVVDGGLLYLLNDQGGLLATFRPETGELVERGRIEQAVDAYYASPVAADGKVYLVSETGYVTVLEAGGSLEPLAVNELGESCYATPAIDGDGLYVRTEAALYRFGSKPGSR